MFSEDMKMTFREDMKKRWSNPETRAKMIAAMTGPKAKAKHEATKAARKAGAAILAEAPAPTPVETPAPAPPASNERPSWLGIAAMRDYVIGLKNKDLWLPLGTFLCPGFLLACYKNVPCSVYAVQLPNRAAPPADIPPEMAELNRRYFTSAAYGLTDWFTIWQIERIAGSIYPFLWRIDTKKFSELYRGQTIDDWPVADFYRRKVQYRRHFSRIVIVPIKGGQ